MFPLSLIFIPIILWFVIGCFRKSKEGFEDGKKEMNPLVGLVSNLKSITEKFMNPTTWTERMELIGKDPVMLARMQIQKEKMKGCSTLQSSSTWQPMI